MKKIGNFLLALSLVVLAQASLAAQVKVEATVDRDQMGIGDSFTLNLSVESDEDFDLGDPEFPKVSGIELINAIPGGRQSSSSMTIVNGKTQFIQRTIQDYNFILSPQKEGTFVIPGIDVKLSGQIYKSNPIKIDVKEEYRNTKKQPKGRPRFPPGYGGQGGAEEDSANNPFGGSLRDDEDLFDQLLKQQQRMFGGGGMGGGFGANQQGAQIPSKQLDVNTRESFFVYLDLDKTTVYEGEQITAKWYIYTKSNIESLDRAKFPDLKGFWKEIIEEVPALQFTEEIVNGIRYKKALLASHALFPIKPGTAVIDEFKIKARVRSLTQFGWGAAQNFTKSSKRAEIKVLPLPQEGRTQSFSGAIGSYHVTLRTDGLSFPANQPFSIKVRYEGIGNAKLIDLPAINWPEGLEVYDTKSDSKFFKDGQSYKEFEILVIPRKEGEMVIPALQLTYFDPQQKKYVSESTQELKLQITPGSLANNTGSANATAANATSESIFKPQPILELPNAGFSFSAYRLPLYIGVLVSGILALLSYLFLQLSGFKHKPQIFVDVKNKLDLVEKYLQSDDYRKIGSEATNLIYILVAHLAGQKRADQELHLLINEIPSKDQQQFLQRIMQLFDYFQLIGFSPDEVKNATLSKKPIREQVVQLKILAEEIVDKLKKQVKNNE